MHWRARSVVGFPERSRESRPSAFHQSQAFRFRPLADAKGGSKVRAMWPVILLIFVLGLQAFALWKGYIGIYGSAVYRSENAGLYWAQLIILGAGALILGVAIARGDL